MADLEMMAQNGLVNAGELVCFSWGAPPRTKPGKLPKQPAFNRITETEIYLALAMPGEEGKEDNSGHWLLQANLCQVLC